MSGVIRIMVTGEHEALDLKETLNGKKVEWTFLPVLSFEKLPVERSKLEEILVSKPSWLIFSSPRGVQYWTEALLENGLETDAETQIACIGHSTSKIAEEYGFTPDFVPATPGTEKFLEEFELKLRHSPKTPILLVTPESGRTAIFERLTGLGFQVQALPVYRTLPKKNISVDLNKVDLILFTSPSSYDALAGQFQFPNHVQMAAIGTYTQEHLVKKGIKNILLLNYASQRSD